MDAYLIRMIVVAAMGIIAALSAFAVSFPAGQKGEQPTQPNLPNLPKWSEQGKMSLEQALAKRRSVRSFLTKKGDKAANLTRQQIAQLCWAAQGISDPARNFRTCPSAGALYPLEVYVVTADGVERYVPRTHSTEQHLTGDVRGKLRDAALGQSFVESAPATFVIAGVFARTERKYGPRAERYVWMEAGHAGQNLLLQAVALGLGSVPVGAFRDAEVAEALGLPRDHAPLYMFPVGVPAGR